MRRPPLNAFSGTRAGSSASQLRVTDFSGLDADVVEDVEHESVPHSPHRAGTGVRLGRHGRAEGLLHRYVNAHPLLLVVPDADADVVLGLDDSQLLELAVIVAVSLNAVGVLWPLAGPRPSARRRA